MKTNVKTAVVSALIFSGLVLVTGPASGQVNKKVYKIKEITKKGNIKKYITKESGLSFEKGSAQSEISSSEIKAYGPTSSASSILNLSPGVNVTESSIMGTKTNISLRGFSGTQTAYTFDGIPIGDLWNGGFQAGNAQLAGAYNLVPITTGEISGVKILYGPPPSNILAIGGLGGNISYLPKLPTKKFYINVFGGYGSYNTRNYGISLNTGNGKNNEFGRLYARFSSKQTMNYQNNTPDRQYSYYLAYKFPTLSNTSRLLGIAYINMNNGYIPQRLPESILHTYGPNFQFPDSDTYQIANSQYLFTALDYKALLSSVIGTHIRMFFTKTDFHSLKYTNPTFSQDTNFNGAISSLFPAVYSSYPNIGYQPSSLNGVDYHSYLYKTQTIGLAPSLRFYMKPFDTEFEAGGLAMLSGYDSNIYWYNSPEMPHLDQYNDAYDEHGYRTYYKIFGMMKSRIGNLTVFPGISYDVESTHFTDVPGYYYAYGATSQAQYSSVSPYIGVKYNLDDRISLTASYSMTSEFPNVSAFYSADDFATATTPAPTPSVGAESVANAQVGLKYRSPSYNLSTTIYRSVFQNTFANYYDPTTGLTHIYNSAPSVRQGIEVSASAKVDNYLTLYGNYSLQDGFYSSNYTSIFGTTIIKNTPIQYVPDYTANIGIAVNYEHLHSRLWFNETGPQYAGASTGVPTSKSLAAYGNVNLAIKYGIPIRHYGINKVDISFIGSNLTGNRSVNFAERFPTFDGTGSYYEVSTQIPRFFGLNLELSYG
ncbi:MAG: TonB-dependent receptor [Acidithiobacillus sp.]